MLWYYLGPPLIAFIAGYLSKKGHAFIDHLLSSGSDRYRCFALRREIAFYRRLSKRLRDGHFAAFSNAILLRAMFSVALAIVFVMTEFWMALVLEIIRGSVLQQQGRTYPNVDVIRALSVPYITLLGFAVMAMVPLSRARRALRFPIEKDTMRRDLYKKLAAYRKVRRDRRSRKS